MVTCYVSAETDKQPYSFFKTCMRIQTIFLCIGVKAVRTNEPDALAKSPAEFMHRLVWRGFAMNSRL